MNGRPSRPSTNFTLSLRLIPNRAWLSLGPGWAALAGVLASGAFQFEADFILKAGLLWLLADPLLGTVWYLLADWGLWQRLTQTQPDETTPLRVLLPYTLKHSPGYSWSIFWTNLSALQSGEGFTFVITLLLALILGGLLGGPVAVYAVISICLAFIAGKHDGPGSRLLQSMATLLFPFWAGATLSSRPTPAILLLGLVYWIVYFGILQWSAGRTSGHRLVIGGQIVAALLLFGLIKPLAATGVALAAIFSLLLYRQRSEYAPDFLIRYDDQLSPLLLAGLFVAALSMGGIL